MNPFLYFEPLAGIRGCDGTAAWVRTTAGSNVPALQASLIGQPGTSGTQETSASCDREPDTVAQRIRSNPIHRILRCSADGNLTIVHFQKRAQEWLQGECSANTGWKESMTNLSELIAKRQRLSEAMRAVKEAAYDVARYRDEALNHVAYAAMWAAVLMATDVVKSGLSAADKRAAFGFSMLDRAIAKANKVLPLLRMAPIATKADALRAVDPNLQGAASFLSEVREARSVLSKARINAPKELDLVLNISLGMAEDTLLLLQAGQQQTLVAQQSAAVSANIRVQLQRMQSAIARLDVAISEFIAQYERNRRIA